MVYAQFGRCGYRPSVVLLLLLQCQTELHEVHSEHKNKNRLSESIVGSTITVEMRVYILGSLVHSWEKWHTIVTQGFFFFLGGGGGGGP